MLISVAVPVPYLDSLTYSVPDDVGLPPIGARVRVMIGRRSVTGCVVGHDAGAADAAAGGADIKAIVEVLDRESFIPPAIVQLCQWVADYYMAGIGDALSAASPPGARATASGFRMRRVAAVTAHGLAAIGTPPLEAPELASEPAAGAGGQRKPPAVTTRQHAALAVIAGVPGGIDASTLRQRGITTDALKRLVAHGFVAMREERDERDPFERSALASVPREVRALTDEQSAALATMTPMADARVFGVVLLHGVTGSGKTEIYLRLAEQVSRAGRQVLLMVPEISLTPGVAALFRTAFGSRVAIQHSALSTGERHDQWHRIRRGDVDVVVGTRSAVFAPLDRLGLVIVDEEHDSSYKQEEAPRYHGRDVAIVRASREGALVVLGSATPSMESFQNAESGKYTRVTLRHRVLDRPLASVTLANMRDEYADQGPDVVISRALATAIDDRLAKREQVLVLLNRRGYATSVFCRQCGDIFECPNCSVSLTVHISRRSRAAASVAPAGDAPRRIEGQGRCHYCNYSLTIPRQCRKCAAPYLEHAGFGTEQVEQHLRQRFPGARVGRVDRDSVRRKGALASILGAFAAGELDILVGTQMIAKGHDFPRVTLVGVVSADVGLGLADFRSRERTFQLLTQVAGRAGRGTITGEAIIQTLFPEHPSIQLACAQDFPSFFALEVEYRRGMRYPPFVALINGIVRGKTFDEAMQLATDLVRRLEPAAAAGSFITLGPAPAPLGRLRGEHRVQFFLKGTRRSDMRSALRAVFAAMPEARRRVTIDVDPLSVL